MASVPAMRLSEQTTPYGLIVETGSPFDEVRLMTVEALGREGFGILSEIDVQETLKRKLGRDVRRYVILGACRPELAFQGISAERPLGLLLPCNVAIWEEPGNGATVGVQRPDLMVQLTGNAALEPMAREAHERLERVLDAVRMGARPRGNVSAATPEVHP
jgi:uncharacterized protein (DUF302 family)